MIQLKKITKISRSRLPADLEKTFNFSKLFRCYCSAKDKEAYNKPKFIIDTKKFANQEVTGNMHCFHCGRVYKYRMTKKDLEVIMLTNRTVSNYNVKK